MEILFYIFSSITLLAAIFTAFSQSSKAAFTGFVFTSAGISGLLLQASNPLPSALIVLFLLMIVSVYTLGYEYFVDKILKESDGKNNIVTVIFTGLLTAVLTSVLGAAKWQRFEIDYGYNNFVLILTKYLPVILLFAITISVLISVLYTLFFQAKTDIK